MEKMTRYLPLGLLLLFAGKALAFTAQPVDAVILAILSILVAYFEFKVEKKELNSLKNDMELCKKGLADNEKLMVEMKNHVNGIKMAQNIRSNAGFR